MVDTDDTRRTPDAGRRTTPWVWHKLPTGELKIKKKTLHKMIDTYTCILKSLIKATQNVQ